jgi:hypothetical protein
MEVSSSSRLLRSGREQADPYALFGRACVLQDQFERRSWRNDSVECESRFFAINRVHVPELKPEHEQLRQIAVRGRDDEMVLLRKASSLELRRCSWGDPLFVKHREWVSMRGHVRPQTRRARPGPG